MVKCRIINRTASAILMLLCYTAIPVAAASERPQKTRRKHNQQQQQHRLQQMDTMDEDYEMFLDLDLPPVDLPPMDTTESFEPPPRFDEDQVNNLDLTEPQEATITGMVYSDIDQNGSREVDTDVPVGGVVVRLFSCSSGARLGQTRTNDSGEYSFTITPNYLPPSNIINAKACFYIQYNVNQNILPNAIFTTPTNGETPDILLVRGQTVTGMDAGAFGSTPDPTPEWTTWSPTIDGTFAPITSPPTPAPVVIVPETPKPTAKPSASPVVMNVNLPLPTDTISLPTSASVGGQGQTVPSENNDVVVAPPVQSPTSTSTSATTAASAGTVLTIKPPGAPSETPPGTGTGGVIWEKDPIVIDDPEDEDISKQELSGSDITKPSEELPSGEAIVQSNTMNATESLNSTDVSVTIDLETRVLVKLSDLQSEMDADAQSLFEKVCVEFLTEQLVIATPPIYNLGCEVVGQSFDEGRRRSRRRTTVRRLGGDEAVTNSLDSSTLSQGSKDDLLRPSYHRALKKSSLTAEVEVTGQANKTASVQEPADVRFQDLLVGTFTVQGRIFTEALKAESLSNTSTAETFDYYGDVGGVRGIATVDGAEAAQDTDSIDGQGDTGLTKGAMAAIAVGGVFSVGLLLLLGMNAKRRRQAAAAAPKGSLSAGRAKKVKDSSGAAGGAAGSKKGSMKSKVTRSRKKSTTSPSPTNASLHTAPSSPTMASYVAPTPPGSPDGDVEIGLDPGMAVVPPPPQPQTKRTRVQKTITAPSGKLGLMVANTKGHGPAVHTIRPGSPMENVIFRGDIIAAVNGVDTRKHTAEQITQIMKDTVGEERKITVLTAHR